MGRPRCCTPRLPRAGHRHRVLNVLRVFVKAVPLNALGPRGSSRLVMTETGSFPFPPSPSPFHAARPCLSVHPVSQQAGTPALRLVTVRCACASPRSRVRHFDLCLPTDMAMAATSSPSSTRTATRDAKQTPPPSPTFSFLLISVVFFWAVDSSSPCKAAPPRAPRATNAQRGRLMALTGGKGKFGGGAGEVAPRHASAAARTRLLAGVFPSRSSRELSQTGAALECENDARGTCRGAPCSC